MQKIIFLFAVVFIFQSCNNANSIYTTAYNTNASQIQIKGLGFSPLEGKVVNTYLNPKEHRASILYISPDSTLSLVTWKQKPDERWFGANIPDAVLSVEILYRKNGINKYEYYSGTALQLVSNSKEAERIA